MLEQSEASLKDTNLTLESKQQEHTKQVEDLERRVQEEINLKE